MDFCFLFFLEIFWLCLLFMGIFLGLRSYWDWEFFYCLFFLELCVPMKVLHGFLWLFLWGFLLSSCLGGRLSSIGSISHKNFTPRMDYLGILLKKLWEKIFSLEKVSLSTDKHFHRIFRSIFFKQIFIRFDWNTQEDCFLRRLPPWVFSGAFSS